MWILALLVITSINSYANQTLEELKAEIETIKEKRCPKDRDISNPSWVKKKVTCLFVIDQHVLNKTTLSSKSKEVEAFISEIFKTNTSELKDILKVYGWLNISKFGSKTDNEAWLIVQHSDHDPEFQASMAFLLENLANIEETNPRNAAYLHDRASLKYQHLGLKQKYGTQYIIKNNDISLQPYEGTLAELKDRRTKMKLEPLERYLNSSKATYIEYEN